MIRILINNKLTPLGGPLPKEISGLDIRYPFINIQIPKAQVAPIKQWFLDIINRCTCEYVVVNNIFTQVKDLKERT